MVDNGIFGEVKLDLGFNEPFVKGKQVEVRNCWHFYTDGNCVDRLFDDREDFIDGMNRVFVVQSSFRVLILAFTLMDTHLHFILYGNFDECQNFMHKYLKLTSMYIASNHSENKKLGNLRVNHQVINNDFYLKTAICYVIKNAPVGGLHYNGFDYPWSSAPLYFRHQDDWTTPMWLYKLTKGSDSKTVLLSSLSKRQKIELLKTKETSLPNARVIDGMVFPGDYVAYQLVEQLFKSHKSYNYFMCITKEEDIESKGGAVSKLTIPIYELRSYRNSLCQELFNSQSIRNLSVEERIKLAKVMKSKYHSSIKQIAKSCGLIYEEVKELLR